VLLEGDPRNFYQPQVANFNFNQPIGIKMTLSFSDLMNSAADAVPTKKKTPDGRYKFVCRSAKFDAKDDGSFRVNFMLVPVQNLADPSVDVDSYEPVFAGWSEKSPAMALEDLGVFIKSHNLSVPFKDAIPELVGRLYVGQLVTRGEFQNFRGLRAED